MLHVIIGAPCSGKSTFIREHAAEGDVLVDYDAIAQAFGCKEAHQVRRRCSDVNLAAFVARRAVIEWAVEHAADVNSWVIHTNPLKEDMEAYEKAQADFVLLDTDMETCLERAAHDGRPQGTDDAIRAWFAGHEKCSKGAEMDIRVKTIEAKADNGSISGYAATWTREPDSYGDVIAKGAFAESLESIKAEGKSIPLLWNHESDNLGAYIGTVTEMREDEHGLYFEAAFDATEKAQRARELASDGRLCKFSFAYDVIEAGEVELEDGRKANELRKLNIHEVSLVMYPANRETSVIEVKSGRRNSAKDAEELERISELCGSIQSIINGLLEESRAEDAQREGADDSEAKAEDADTRNAEEPMEKDANIDALLKQAEQILKEG